MLTKFGLPIRCTGADRLCGAVILLNSQERIAASMPPPVQPAENPFPNTVAGAGMVEPETENIFVGSPVPGVVVEVMAKVGQKVKAGDPLFRLDDRQLRAELAIRQAMLEDAKASLAKLDAMPRHGRAAAGRGQGARGEGRLGELGAAVVARREAACTRMRCRRKSSWNASSRRSGPRAVERARGRLRPAEGGCVGATTSKWPRRRSIAPRPKCRQIANRSRSAGGACTGRWRSAASERAAGRVRRRTRRARPWSCWAT